MSALSYYDHEPTIHVFNYRIKQKTQSAIAAEAARRAGQEAREEATALMGK